MSNKTISINPSLFTLSGNSKTKKNREKKQKSTITPLISPNVLKNKLLKRIKEHKQKETENIDNKKKNNNSSDLENLELKELNKFNDEFNDSLNYLQTLSKQKKMNDEKSIYEKQKKIKKDEIERKTLKNYNPNQNENSSYVNLELPQELQIKTEEFISTEPKIIIKPNTSDSVPYGILKGGNKPTYRDWNKTQKNNLISNPHACLSIEGIELNKSRNERENRLNLLREKLKNKQQEKNIPFFN